MTVNALARTAVFDSGAELIRFKAGLRQEMCRPQWRIDSILGQRRAQHRPYLGPPRVERQSAFQPHRQDEHSQIQAQAAGIPNQGRLIPHQVVSEQHGQHQEHDEDDADATQAFRGRDAGVEFIVFGLE
jgi:hypothetical protein